MKSTFILSALFLISFSLSAQIPKGSLLLGTDLSFSGSSTSSENPSLLKINSAGLNFAVNAGKATRENSFAGGRLSYSFANKKSKFNDTLVYKADKKGYGASFWIRKYYPLLKRFYAFIDGSISVNGISDKMVQSSSNPQFEYTQKSNGLTINIAVYPGLSYQIKKNFFIESSINTLAGISYNYSKLETFNGQNKTTSSTTNGYGFYTSIGDISNPLQLGIRWIIPGKS
jgi:hypothetical protein